MAIERALLIGNGFNLVSDQGASWNKLLNTLAGKAVTKHEEEVRKAKPFTLWFEEISNTVRSENLKEKIAQYLENNVTHNKHHQDVMNLGIKNILTTNYDYNLEESTGEDWYQNHPAKENYYSLFRRNSLAKNHVWHIHGEIDNVRSIMLGHEQYTGYNQKIANYLSSGVPTEVKDRKGKPYLSKFSRKARGRKGDVETWVDIFLESEVHIIGFSLDYTENHLWSLITKKNNIIKNKGIDVGRAVFHRCSDKRQSTADEARLSILSALGVDVRDHTAKTYPAAYDKCIKSLR
ncbi:MAG: SIR2 family protein [Candidatus Thiodiazotropha sp.]